MVPLPTVVALITTAASPPWSPVLCHANSTPLTARRGHRGWHYDLRPHGTDTLRRKEEPCGRYRQHIERETFDSGGAVGIATLTPQVSLSHPPHGDLYGRTDRHGIPRSNDD